MDTSVDKDLITRSGLDSGRVITSKKLWEALKGVKRIKRSHRQIQTENFFRVLLVVIAVMMVALVVGIMITLIWKSVPSIQATGAGYLWGKTWDPVRDIYGAYPFLLGTLITSFLALIISIPFSFAVGIFLGEYYPNGWLPNLLKNTVELIAAVPSVIYGFWGLAVLVPLVRQFETGIGVSAVGQGIFTSSLILAVMIIPYAASLSQSMIKMVPSSLKEAAYSLGATRWEVIRSVILPYTKSGLFAGVLLSLGRALGETMAVTMVIGNTTNFLETFGLHIGHLKIGSIALPSSVFTPANTMASVIANEFAEADHPVYLSALIELALVLFLVTVVINMIGKRLTKRFTK